MLRCRVTFNFKRNLKKFYQSIKDMRRVSILTFLGDGLFLGRYTLPKYLDKELKPVLKVLNQTHQPLGNPAFRSQNKNRSSHVINGPSSYMCVELVADFWVFSRRHITEIPTHPHSNSTLKKNQPRLWLPFENGCILRASW